MERNRLATCALSAFAALLVSCGGGGGGSGSSSSSSSSGGSGNVRFSADRTAIALDYIEGGTAPTQSVVITATGSYSGTLYLGAVADGQGIDPAITLSILSDTQGSFAIRAAPNLPIGTYTGTIQLLACADEVCNRQVGNSPVRVTYTTIVHTALHVSASTVNLAAVSGTTATQDVTITLPWNSTSFNAQANDPSWLAVSSPTATTLRLTARSIPVGTRQTTVLVSSGNDALPITVNYSASAPPGGEHDLRATPTSITMSAVEGTLSAPVMLNVLGPTWDPQAEHRVSVHMLDGAQFGWLGATAEAGGYRIQGDANHVPAGSYHGEVTLNIDLPAHPVTIPVAFTVGVGLATPANIDVTIDSNTTPASPILRGSVPVNIVSGAPLDWTATQNQPWLALTRAAGTSGTNIDFVVDISRLSLDYQPYGEDWATVVIHPADPRMTTVEFRINVHKRLAQVFAISPYYQMLGESSRHVVTGRGFIANRNWAQKLLINGVPAGSRLTRVNDTKLLVNLDPAVNDRVYFEPTNELVAAPASDPLRVLQPRTYPYTVIPTGYQVKTLIHNHESEKLYLLERTDNNPRLISYANFIGSWQGNGTVTIPGAKDVVEDISGRAMYAAGDLGFQGISFPNLSQPYMPPGGMFIAPYGSNIIQTNDLRIWFSTGQQGLAYFDFPSGEVVTVTDRLSGTNGGPWFAKSGDGDRLFISMAQGGSNYPLLLMNTTDYVLRMAPETGIDNALTDASVSDDGSRSVNEWRRVRDGQFLPIGLVEPMVNNWVATAAVISRDGRRAYTFAFDFDDFYRTTTIHRPRIYVFDITTPVGVEVPFPSMGYFSLPDYPMCMAPFPDCYGPPKMKMSPDGRTLFLAGGLNLIIAPIPPENTLTSAAPPRVGKQGIRTKAWRVDTRAH